jgi:hypothetical protein
MVSYCSNNDNTPTAPQVIIKVGDSIEDVIEVYGDSYTSMSYYYQENGHSISGFILTYSNPDLTFYFDDSSPRKVIRIVGNQGG